MYYRYLVVLLVYIREIWTNLDYEAPEIFSSFASSGLESLQQSPNISLSDIDKVDGMDINTTKTINNTGVILSLLTCRFYFFQKSTIAVQTVVGHHVVENSYSVIVSRMYDGTMYRESHQTFNRIDDGKQII